MPEPVQKFLDSAESLFGYTWILAAVFGLLAMGVMFGSKMYRRRHPSDSNDISQLNDWLDEGAY